MFVEMKVRGLALDAVSNMPIIILRDEEDKRSLQIWVGIFEANAIALEREKVAPARPMTHDLIKNILETLEARVLKVVVTDLKENTFFAVLHLQLGETEYTVDCARRTPSRSPSVWRLRSTSTKKSFARRRASRSPGGPGP
jgi:bifunctional DNase/RNase